MKMLILISLSLFPYEGAKMYSFLPIKQCDGLKMLECDLKKCILNTILYFWLIDILISLFCCVLHFLHLVLCFFCFYTL